MADIRPKYYTDLTPEPITVIEGWGLGFNLGSVLKYISRAGRKGDALDDLRKAQFYLAREIVNRAMAAHKDDQS